MGDGKPVRAKTFKSAGILALATLYLFLSVAHSQEVIKVPTLTFPAVTLPTVTVPAVTTAPVATKTPAKETPAATETPPVPSKTPATTKSPKATTAPVLASPPPLAPSPPPSPPGAGSSKTAVLSVISLSGSNLAKFNNELGSKFTAALSDILNVPSSSIIIRNWQNGSSRRRAMLQQSDDVLVGSLANMGNGINAASGLATLKSADLKAAFQKQGLDIQTSNLQSAETVIPSNSQPLEASQASRGLRLWAWILIALAGVISILTILLCCCRQYICCCCMPKDGDESLPDMIKFGARKDEAQPYFYSDQTFARTNNLVSKQELQPAILMPEPHLPTKSPLAPYIL